MNSIAFKSKQPFDLYKNLKAALEERTDGVADKEKEYVWYGQISDFAQLKGAVSTETQSQSSMKGANGTTRVRRVLKDDGQADHFLTCKNYTGNGECDEVTQRTTEDMWKAYRGATKESMDKVRYVFPIEGTNLKWEVDVFVGPDQAGFKPWCKIDLESPTDLTEFPELPIQLNEVIFHPLKQYTPEQDKKVKELYANVFINKL